MRGLRGNARKAYAWPRVVDTYGHLVPRYPGPDVVPLARTPAPSKLDPDEPLPTRVQAVVGAYQCATRHFFGPWVGTFPRPVSLRELQRSTHWRQLQEATEYLTERKRAPVAWCAFSAFVWRAYYGQGKLKAAPVSWVLSLKRLQEREEWFAWQQGRYSGGRVFIVPAQRELLQRFEEMRRDLLALPKLDEAAVRGVVRRHFPGKLYDQLVAEAREQVVDRVETLRRQAQRGGFIW